MKNPKLQCVFVAVLLTAAGLLLIPSLTQANPKGVPAWQDRQDPEPQRDGYSRSFVVDANSVLFTVPEGKRYVLLRLYARVGDYEEPFNEWMESYWTLTVDGDMFLDEAGLTSPNWTSWAIVREDFPDGTVVM